MMDSSQIDGRSLVYVNNNIDRLIHLVSLYLTKPERIGASLQKMAVNCENTTFYCNLCEFAVNITSSCQR